MTDTKDIEVGPRGAWTRGPVFHCEGGVAGFNRMKQAHHINREPYRPCWRCKRALGCFRCADINAENVYCEPCGVWQTKEALLKKGVHRGIRLGNHPVEWIALYRFAVQSGEMFRMADPMPVYFSHGGKPGEQADMLRSLWGKFKQQQFEAIQTMDRGREPGMEG